MSGGFPDNYNRDMRDMMGSRGGGGGGGDMDSRGLFRDLVDARGEMRGSGAADNRVLREYQLPQEMRERVRKGFP